MTEVVVSNAEQLSVAAKRMYAMGASPGIPTTIRVMAGEYLLTDSQLPLQIRSHQAIVGAGSGQSRLIHVLGEESDKNVIELVEPGGAVFNARVSGLSIQGNSDTTAGVYAKGLWFGILQDLQIYDIPSGIGVQLDASFGFGVYFNMLQSVHIGYMGEGCNIGIRLLSDVSFDGLKRANSNALQMCTARFCTDAGIELIHTASAVLTSCEMELNDVGLRALSCLDMVLNGGYLEANTSADIQLGDPGTSGTDTNPTLRTCLLRPILVSTTRLTGKSVGSTGDFYLLANSSDPPSKNKTDGNWLQKAYIANLAAAWIEFAAYDTAARVGWFKLDGESHYRHEIWNDGKMTWGSGSAPLDIELKRYASQTLSLGDDDDFRLGGLYNGGRLRFGDYYLYVDSNKKLRFSDGVPSSDGDGTDLGTAT